MVSCYGDDLAYDLEQSIVQHERRHSFHHLKQLEKERERRTERGGSMEGIWETGRMGSMEKRRGKKERDRENVPGSMEKRRGKKERDLF